jgi:hypothetical protein
MMKAMISLQSYCFWRHEGEDPRYFLILSRDAIPLTVTDLDDALVRAAGDDEGQDPRYNPPD